jgi:hypothetical protein
MNWKSFLEHLPKVGERILVVREWIDYDVSILLKKHYIGQN